MNLSTDDKDTICSKVENNNNYDDHNDDRLSKALARAASSSSVATSTSRQWSGFKNPRIVRVSRTFGGKDRHSKVCTIRGLRDRRIRLSVPTAIQLYDLQDRLGVNQPSKVIDWLLDATKLDIDKLPPLQIPPGSFGQFHHQQQPLIGQFANANAFAPTHNFTTYWDANLGLMKEGASGNKEKININDDVEDDEDEDDDEDDRSIEAKLETIRWNNKEDQGNRASSSVQISPQSLFPMGGNNGFLPGLMNSSALPYSSLYHWDPANLSLSQFGGHGSLAPHQAEAHQHHHSNNNYPAGGGSSSSTHQLFFCPPAANNNTSIFLPQDTRFHQSNSSLLPSQNNAGHPDKGHN